MTTSFGKVRYALAFLFVMLAANFLAAQTLRPGSDSVQDRRATGHNQEAEEETMDKAGPTGQAVVTGNGINYHGGPVLKGTVPIYLIWYGNWSGTGSNTAATVSLVEHFIGTLGNTPYELINSTYGDTTGNVSGNLTIGGAIFDTGSQGTRLTNSRLTAIVQRSLSNGLPTDANGVYMVLTSSNVREQGFCTQFCGFHTHQTLNGTDIKWAFVDGMINIITHESEEAITDPDLNAWFDSSGQEDADKCNFNFGATSTCTATSICSAAGKAAGAKFNQTFGNNNYLMQQEWENAAGGKCVQHL